MTGGRPSSFRARSGLVVRWKLTPSEDGNALEKSFSAESSACTQIRVIVAERVYTPFRSGVGGSNLVSQIPTFAPVQSENDCLFASPPSMEAD
jgi:hypothetical protein